MKVSLPWLQKYFDRPLTLNEAVDALTFHSSEVDEVIGEGENAVLDVKVLPDRAPYALSHRGVAYELAAALNRNLVNDPFAEALPEWPTTENLQLPIATDKCVRHTGALVRGVKVGPSPEWLKSALESLGQRSINNIVDATNYVMLSMGQPLHAFDVAKITKEGDLVTVGVRRTIEGESIQVLSGETYQLPEDTLVLCEGTDGRALDIAGIKGGMASAITEQTTDVLLSAANFDPVTIRRTSQALKLWTDASQRFQNKISPELTAYGMRDLIALVTELAGGTLEGVVDTYPTPEPKQAPVSVSLERVNGILGTSYRKEEVVSALDRLRLEYSEEEIITIVPPFMRRDITNVQDVAEEVGRILGYDRVLPTPLPPMTGKVDQGVFKGIERIKDVLLDRGFIEISTQSFAVSGDIELANPLDTKKPWLRTSLADNMRAALGHAKSVAPRVIGPEPSLKLFELGSVFETKGEHFSLALGYVALQGKQSKTYLADVLDALASETGLVPDIRVSEESLVELDLSAVDLGKIGEGYEPKPIRSGMYMPFSVYPFALRDVAVWTPADTEESEVLNAIVEKAGELLARIDLFDKFEKEGCVSYAFRLVFEASDRTLSDEDLTPVMEAVTARLNANEGWEVR